VEELVDTQVEEEGSLREWEKKRAEQEEEEKKKQEEHKEVA